MSEIKKPRSAVEARKLARENMAAKLKAQQERDRQNEADLTTFFELDATVAKAAEQRDAVITKAHADYVAATTGAQVGQAEALGKMKDRGLAESELAELTGLTLSEVRKTLKAKPAVSAPVASPAKTENKPQPAAAEPAEPAEPAETVGVSPELAPPAAVAS